MISLNFTYFLCVLLVIHIGCNPLVSNELQGLWLLLPTLEPLQSPIPLKQLLYMIYVVL